MDESDSRMPASSSTIRMCGFGGIRKAYKSEKVQGTKGRTLEISAVLEIQQRLASEEWATKPTPKADVWGTRQSCFQERLRGHGYIVSGGHRRRRGGAHET